MERNDVKNNTIDDDTKETIFWYLIIYNIGFYVDSAINHYKDYDDSDRNVVRLFYGYWVLCAIT